MNMPMPSALASKKFLAAIAASVIAYLCKRAGMDNETTLLIIGSLIAYLPCQAASDFGKEKAKIEAAAGASGATPQPTA